MHGRLIVCHTNIYTISFDCFISLTTRRLMIQKIGMIDLNDFPRYNNNDDDEAATHHVKFDLIEDKYAKQWQQCVKFGHWITADISCLAGWYHSPVAIGPDEKPIYGCDTR